MLKRWMLLFSAIFLVARSALAEPYAGFSALSALSDKFPCGKYLQIANRAKKPAMVVLHGTFGASYDCVNRFIQENSHRGHLVQIHPINGPCRRNRRCYEGELLPRATIDEFNRRLEAKNKDLLDRIRERIAVIKIAVERGEKTELVLSTGLEDNYTPKAFQVIYDVVREEWHDQIVRNPAGSSCDCVSIECETHGVQPDKFARIWNQDGDDLPLSDDRKWLRACRGSPRLACFLWGARAQGIFNSSFVRPRSRTFEITNFDILSYGQLIGEN